MAWLWSLLPFGRVTAAWWAWRNRREVGRWLGFALRAVPPSAAGRRDLLTEARLRAAFAKHARTRGVPSLTVRVHAGTASLAGSLPPGVHDLAVGIAGGTKGVVRVDCAIRDRGHRRIPNTHPHRTTVLPPPPLPPQPAARSRS